MKKILLAEDDIFLNKVYTSLLRKQGYQVVSLRSGKEVVKTAEVEKPDLIILDLIMPEKDGFDALRDLQSNHVTSKIPTITLSVLNADEDVKKVLTLGSIKHITKGNFTFNEVITYIGEFIRS